MGFNEKMTTLADAIRNKTNQTGSLSLDTMAESVENIEVGGVDTSDATAQADEIFAGETAYVDGEKITGTFTIDNELTTQDDLIGQIQTALQNKATPQGGTDTSDATATAGDILNGKTAYVKGSKVTGTITSKTSSDLTASGATVTVPAGHYASQATKSVTTGSAKTPATTVTKNPTISVSSSGLITASVSGTQSVTPTVTAGYVSSGTAGTITVSGSATKQLTTQAAQTITPGTSNKTISSGRYLTGTQTIKGDANLKAENIASGVSIFGVTGTHSGGEDLDAELTAQENLISQLSNILDSKASGGGSNTNFLVINEFPIPILVNGISCEPSQETSVPYLPNSQAILFTFILDGSEEIDEYFVISDNGEVFPIFSYGCDDLYDSKITNGPQPMWASFSDISGFMSVSGFSYSMPWDYDNGVPLNNGNINFWR